MHFNLRCLVENCTLDISFLFLFDYFDFSAPSSMTTSFRKMPILSAVMPPSPFCKCAVVSLHSSPFLDMTVLGISRHQYATGHPYRHGSGPQMVLHSAPPTTKAPQIASQVYGGSLGRCCDRYCDRRSILLHLLYVLQTTAELSALTLTSFESLGTTADFQQWGFVGPTAYICCGWSSADDGAGVYEGRQNMTEAGVGRAYIGGHTKGNRQLVPVC
jgi:hypothetical protein